MGDHDHRLAQNIRRARASSAAPALRRSDPGGRRRIGSTRAAPHCGQLGGVCRSSSVCTGFVVLRLAVGSVVQPELGVKIGVFATKVCSKTAMKLKAVKGIGFFFLFWIFKILGPKILCLFRWLR